MWPRPIRPCRRGQSLARRLASALLPLVLVSGVAAQDAAAPAAPAAPIPVEHFFRAPLVDEAELSPDGRRLAVTTARGATRTGVVVFDLDGGKPPVRAVQFRDADVLDLHWLGNDQLVFSVHDAEAGSGQWEREAPGLFAVRADGSDLRSLIQRRWVPIDESRPLARRALPWNHLLLQVPRPGGEARPDEILIGRSSYSNTELDHVQPMWLDVRTLRTRAADFPAPPGGATLWLFDRQGRPRLAGARHGDRLVYWWRAPGRDDWQRLAEHPLMGAPWSPRFVDDAGRLYVTRPEAPQGRRALYRYDTEKNRLEGQPLVQVKGFDFRGTPRFDETTGALLGLQVTADAEVAVWYDAQLQRLQQAVDDQLPGRINRLDCRRCGSADAVVLVRSYSDQDPGQLLLYRPATRAWQRVAASMDGIEPARMARVELHRIAARDGRELPVWITRPAGVPENQPLPAVVMVHGGPWVRGGFWHWDATNQFLASRGYLVISPDFRGSSGYGAAHFRAGFKQFGRAMQDDLADALLWARRSGLAAPDRACIAGASYGGYATLMGLVRHAGLYRCGIAWAAVADLLLYVQGEWFVRDDISEAGRRYSLPEMVGDPDTEAAWLKAVSPVEQAAQIKAPLLLAFGEVDRRVPLAHGQRLRRAMQAAGQEPEWVVYPDEGHGWRKPEHRFDWARRMERFLARHLAGPSPPLAPAGETATR